MYKHEYQGGASVEILSCQGKDPLSKWKVSSGVGAAKRTYDKDIKGFVCHLEGSTATSKLQLPKDSTKQTLHLTQRYLMLQVFIPSGKDFSVELSMCDTTNSKRRLLMSTSIRDVSITPLHAKLNLSVVKRNVWLNLCFDLVSLMTEIFRKQQFKSLDVIIVGGNCKVRKIFTMRNQPPDSTESESVSSSPTSDSGNAHSGIFQLENVPPHLQFGSMAVYMTQVINVKKIKAHINRNEKPDIRSFSSFSSTSSSDFNRAFQERNARVSDRDASVPLTQIAFGTHIKVDSASNVDKKSSRSARSLIHHKRRTNTPRTDLESQRSGISETQNNTHHDFNLDNSSRNDGRKIVLEPFVKSSYSRENSRSRSSKKIPVSFPNRSVEQLPASLAQLVDEIDVATGDGKTVNVASFSSRPHAAHSKAGDMPLSEFDSKLNEDFIKSDSSDSDDNFSQKGISKKPNLPGNLNLRSHDFSPKLDKRKNPTLRNVPKPADIASQSIRRYDSLNYSEPDFDDGERRSLDIENGFNGPAEATQRLRDSDTTLISSVDTLVHHSINKDSEIFPEDSIEEERPTLKYKHNVSGNHGITVSRKTLREIPYAVDPWTESFEEHMLSRMKAEQEEEMMKEEERISSNKDFDNSGPNTTNQFDDSDPYNGSFDASWSTWKQPPPLNSEAYAPEMKGMETLALSLNYSDPRKSANLRSPPIVLPSDRAKQEKDFASVSDALGMSDGSTVSGHSASVQESDDEEMLDLMYDPCLNCYFDPKSGRYYELKG